MEAAQLGDAQLVLLKGRFACRGSVLGALLVPALALVLVLVLFVEPEA